MAPHVCSSFVSQVSWFIPPSEYINILHPGGNRSSWQMDIDGIDSFLSIHRWVNTNDTHNDTIFGWMNIDFSDILRRTAGYRGLDRGSDIVETSNRRLLVKTKNFH